MSGSVHGDPNKEGHAQAMKARQNAGTAIIWAFSVLLLLLAAYWLIFASSDGSVSGIATPTRATPTQTTCVIPTTKFATCQIGAEDVLITFGDEGLPPDSHYPCVFPRLSSGLFHVSYLPKTGGSFVEWNLTDHILPQVLKIHTLDGKTIATHARLLQNGVACIMS